MTKALHKKMGGFELVKEITFNIFESKEVDLMENQEQKKRKRKIDDYDYEDDFIEPFEGEDELVDIECKLENFFIYKGEMKHTPKRIISTYRNRIKKKGNKKEEKPKEEIYEKKTFRANVDDDIKVQIEAAVGFSLDDDNDEEKAKKPKRKRVRNKEKIVKEKDTENVNDNVLPVLNATLIKNVGPSANDFNVPQHVVNPNIRPPLCKPEEIEEVFYLKKSLIRKNPNLIHPMARNPLPYNPYNNRPISKSEEGMILNEYPTHFFSSSPNMDIKRSFRSKNEYKNFKRNDMQHKNEQQDLLKMFGASSPNHSNKRTLDPNGKEKNLQQKIKSNEENVCVNENTKQQTINPNQEYVEANDAKNLKKLEPIIVEPVKEEPEVSELQQVNSEPTKRKYRTRNRRSAEVLAKEKVELTGMINMKVQEMSNEFLKEAVVNQSTVEPVKESVVFNESSIQPVDGPMKELSQIAKEQGKDANQSTDFPNTVIKIKNMPQLKSETTAKVSKKINKKPDPKTINALSPIVTDNYSESVILVEAVSSSPKSDEDASFTPCTKTIHSLTSSNLLRYYLQFKMKRIENKLDDPITPVFFFYFNLIAHDISSEDYVINYSLLEEHCPNKQNQHDDYSDPKNLFTEETLKKFEKAVDEHLERVMARLRRFSEDPNMYDPAKKIFFGFENDSFIKNSIVLFYLICCREIHKGSNYKKAFEYAKGMVFELIPKDISTLKFVRRITMVLRNLLKENNTLV